MVMGAHPGEEPTLQGGNGVEGTVKEPAPQGGVGVEVTVAVGVLVLGV
jgi:hypothetical protein